MELDKKYTDEIDNFINGLQKRIHSELFPEESDDQGDSSADAYDRRNGKNPMNSEYIQKVKARREKLGVPALGANGLPVDNATEIYVQKKLIEILLQKLNNQTIAPKPKKDISSFFKSQK